MTMLCLYKFVANHPAGSSVSPSASSKYNMSSNEDALCMPMSMERCLVHIGRLASKKVRLVAPTSSPYLNDLGSPPHEYGCSFWGMTCGHDHGKQVATVRSCPSEHQPSGILLHLLYERQVPRLVKWLSLGEQQITRNTAAAIFLSQVSVSQKGY
jgi:hypothetical protein